MRFAGFRFAGLCGLCGLVVALATPAFGADMPFLRGSRGFLPSTPHYFDWGGVYVGGQGGYSSGSADFSQGTGDLVSYILRNTTIENEAQVSSWTTLPTKNGMTSTSWGGFVGFNAQFDDAVIGIEANYSRVDMQAVASDSLERSYQTSDQYFYNVALGSTAGVKLSDIGTLRARGGWAASWYMPYAFGGLAVARADVERSATVELQAVDLSGTGRPNLGLGPVTRIDNRSDVYAFGWTVGAGIDVALMANLFLRAEYEYVRFGDIEGTEVSINSVRGGLGLKF
ncbi:hypothetical protein A33M_2622 [Rhodovulum sp. PH10]|uniref:outer membrane protein n=1 Tax=Rhodovulum sp. PH10 TaxID=1187851 RepID=UPI00027C21D2|nr:outer membrane beta-barrel protein [Rhodovulum sp. PH10]EJW11972.1 hypothetical protein A33M_2622 [Rhodovulum sp. PH10]